MPVLREVITRFKFETDEQAARKVDQRVNKMKRGIGTIGKVLGVSLGLAGAKALFSFGQSASRAEFTLKNLAGVEFSPLRKNMNQIRKDLDSLRYGAGQIFSERDFDIAAAGFVRTFGTGSDKLELFNKLFTSAAKQSAITGKNVVEIVKNLTQAVTGGDFSELLNLPGVDQAAIKRLEDTLSIIDPGEIGGQAAIQQRIAALLDLLTEAGDQQNASIRQIPANLLLADRAAKKTETSMERLAKNLNKTLVPAIEKLNKVLDRFIDTSEKIEKKGFLGTIQESIKNLRSNLRSESEQRISDLRRGVTSTGLRREVRAAQRQGPLPGGENSILFKTEINVNGTTDPASVAKEVERLQTQTYKNALRGVVPTEDR